MKKTPSIRKYKWKKVVSMVREEGASTLRNPIEKFLNKIICGDCFQLIEEIPDRSIDLVITSPPYYKQRDYGAGIGNEKSVQEYIENLKHIFHECSRILKDTGSIVFNLGDKYENSKLLLIPYRFAIEVLEQESVFLVNSITWVKENPTPRQYKRRLVNSSEPFFHFANTNDYYYSMNAFLNYSESRTRKPSEGRENNIGRRYFELIKNSSLSETEKRLTKNELMEVIQEVRSRKIESFRMKIRGIHSMPFGGQEGGRKIQLTKKGFTIIKILGNSIKRDIVECPEETIKGIKNPAVYPEFIIQELLKLLTRKNDLVLDPFMGSGTTALACKKLERNYIGFEINPVYCRYAEERLESVKFEPFLMELPL